MKPLFDIASDLHEVFVMAESGDYDEEAIANAIEQIEMELEKKADNYAALIKLLDGDNATIDREIMRLKGLKDNRDNLKERLKNNLMNTMAALGRPKIKTALHSFTIRKNPPAVSIHDERRVPQRYYIASDPKISKSMILAALKRGEDVPGATLTQGESLNIR